MRFCDLFISYKIGLKNIKSTIPFTKLPLYRKIFVIILFASAITSGILLIFRQTWASYIPIGLGVLSLIIFFIIDILYRDYNKYDDLIYDLRQIKLFYVKENDTYTN